MDTSAKTALVIASVILALVALLFGGGVATATMISGGIARSSLDGIGWMWLPASIVAALGIVLFSVTFGRK